MKKLRVPIPRNKQQLIILAEKILTKHQAEGEKSVLKLIDFDSMSTKIEGAMDIYQRANDLRAQARQVAQQSDLMLQEIENLIQNSRDVLTGIHKQEMKVLGEWGFTVLEPANKATKIATSAKEDVKV